MTADLLLADATAGLGLLLRATLLMGAAWAGAAALRKAGASAAARHTAWLLCIVALLALPLLRWLVPALHLPILPADAALPAGGGASPPLAFAPPAAALGGSVAPDSSGWWSVLPLAYAFGAIALLLRLAAGRWMLARLWRDAAPAADEAWEHLLSRLSREMRLQRPVTLRIAPGPVMPMTWGTRAPRLLLPAEAHAWPPEQRRLVLLHELAHVARRDSLSRSAASLACALYWFHPGVWFAARRMRIEQEHAADDRVLTAGGSAQAYARSLLDIAREIGDGLRPDLAATMVGTCQLERRLVSITRPARRDRPTPAFVSSSAVLAAVATLIVAAGAPVRASSTLLGSREAAGSLVVFTGKRAASPPDASETRAPAPAAAEGSTQADASGALDFRRQGQDAAERTGEEEAARRGETVARDARSKSPGEEGNSAQPAAPAYAQQLPDYGWGLRRRDPAVQIVALASPSQRARLPLPAGHAASSEPTGRPKWARFLPQLGSRNMSMRTPQLVPDRVLTLTMETNAP